MDLIWHYWNVFMQILPMDNTSLNEHLFGITYTLAKTILINWWISHTGYHTRILLGKIN